jgi:hypothetical protein
LLAPTQAKKLITPTNPKAVGAQKGEGAKRSSLVTEDSEAGVKKEEEALKAKLKNINPPKLTADGATGDDAIVINIQIAGFATPAGAGAAAAA